MIWVSRTSLFGLGAAACAALAYGAIIEPYWLVLRRFTIWSTRLPEQFDGFRILHVSDLHMRQLGRRERILGRLIGQIPVPDIVAVTGDLVYTSKGVDPFLCLAASFQSNHGIYVTYGNSEHKNGVRPLDFARKLTQAGMTPLINAHVECNIGGQSITIAGVDDPVSEHDDIDAALQGVCADRFVLMLMHTPDSVGLACAKGLDLVLSGHTHGGQVCLPIWGPLFTHSKLGNRMSHGHYAGRKLRDMIGFRPGRTQLYVTRGVGVSGLALRLLCKPEINLITLKRSV